MPLNYGNSDVAVLMRGCGDVVGMDWGDTSSSADPSYVGGAFRYYFNYASAAYESSYSSGSFNTVKSNLNYGWPVLLGGATDQNWLGITSGGHLWVCDGYLASECDGYGYLYFSMNWGWDGRYNGWYAYNNWTVNQSNGTSLNFQYGKHMVYNIHP